MALPDRDVAVHWVGRTVVDRDGAEIGACTAVFADDATSRPEWVCAELGGLSVFVPVVDAVESSGRVRVAVSRADVAGAPPVGDAQRLSEDEEAALYRHYGIESSRAASESLLPESAASPSAGFPTHAAAATAERVTAPAGADEAVVGDQPDSQVVVSQFGEPASPKRGQRRLVLLAGVLGGLAAILGAVAVRRLRTRRPATRSERITKRVRGASTVLTARGGQLAASAAPLLDTSKQVVWRGAQVGAAAAGDAAASAVPVAVAAGTAAARSGRRAAELAGTAGHTGARRAATAGRTAAVAARGAGSQAGRLAAAAVSQAAAAGNSGIRGSQQAAAPPGSIPDVVSDRSQRLQKKWRRVMGKLTAALSFGAGYMLGSPAGRAQLRRLPQTAAAVAQRPQVQQTRDRVKTIAGDKLHSGTGRARQRTAGVTGKLRRRSSTSTGAGSDTPSQPGNGLAGESPSGAAFTQDPPGALPDPNGGVPGTDSLR